MPKSEKELLEEINKKLDKVLIAIILQSANPVNQVRILINCGYKNKEISKITGLSVVDVQNIKARKLKIKKSQEKI